MRAAHTGFVVIFYPLLTYDECCFNHFYLPFAQEPTNHMDVVVIDWLQSRLVDPAITLVLVRASLAGFVPCLCLFVFSCTVPLPVHVLGFILYIRHRGMPSCADLSSG